jgi:TolB protein
MRLILMKFFFSLLQLTFLFAGLVQAEPQKILFTRLSPGDLQLFISKADGTEEEPLLSFGQMDYNPVWSADGQWIVFTSERNGSADLYRVKPDGSALERLTDNLAYDDQASLSPDGKRAVFVTTRADGTADLWILDLKKRTARPLTSGPGGDFRPAWSPDGQWIAFSSDRGSTLPPANGRWEHLHLVDLYIIHPDGSGMKRISPHGNFCGSPQWMPDSQHVVSYCMSAQETFTYRMGGSPGGPVSVQGNTRLRAFDINTGKATDIPSGDGIKVYPSVLRSGEVAYVVKYASRSGVFYANGKSGPPGYVRAPSWSPDGSRVVYAKPVPSDQSRAGRSFWSRDPRYELSAAASMFPSFDPSGKQYAGSVAQKGKLALGIVESVTGEAKVIYRDENRNVIAASWSPVDDSILFGLGEFQGFMTFDPVRDPAQGGAQVAMVNLDGSGFQELTTGRNNNGNPSWAPDGKRFVYRTMGPDGSGLRVMNLADKSVIALTKEYDNFPAWSPRGDLIMFARRVREQGQEQNYDIFTIHPDGTGLKRLTNTPGNDAHMGWSPDGEWILFSSSRMGFKDEALYTDGPQPYGEIFKMRFDGASVSQLTDNQWEDGAPGWQPQPKAKTGDKSRTTSKP